jgi:hypothetical protein
VCAGLAYALVGGLIMLPATEWSSAELRASLAFLIIGAQAVTYIGFYVALSHWTSARVFSWTFLVLPSPLPSRPSRATSWARRRPRGWSS